MKEIVHYSDLVEKMDTAVCACY